MTAALEGGEWSATRPGRTLPPGKTRYPFYRRLGGPQGRSGRAENHFLTGIRSRTVQSVVQSLYRLSYRAHITFSTVTICWNLYFPKVWKFLELETFQTSSCFSIDSMLCHKSVRLLSIFTPHLGIEISLIRSYMRVGFFSEFTICPIFVLWLSSSFYSAECSL